MSAIERQSGRGTDAPACRLLTRIGLAALATRRIFGLMGSSLAEGVYVVVATGHGETEYWAAATSREEAVAAVQGQLPPDWTVKLTVSRITVERAASLNLQPNGVKQLVGTA
jgi:hypothetical protein